MTYYYRGFTESLYVFVTLRKYFWVNLLWLQVLRPQNKFLTAQNKCK